MADLSSKNKLFCLVRRRWVSASPEEKIRQAVLSHMLSDLKFPLGLIALEKALSQLPHLKTSQKIPNRRTDLICFANEGGHALYPLLILECKAIPLTEAAITQVIGYNHFIAARFISIANGSEIRTGWYDQEQKTYEFVPYLPSYESLLKKIRYERK